MLDHVQHRCRPVRLEDRAFIDAIRANAGHTLSAHAFSSLFLWQKALQLSVCLDEDAFFVRFAHRGENAWFYPCGSQAAQAAFLQAGLDSPDFSVHYVRREDMDFVHAHFPGRFRFEEAPGDAEYICEREPQIQMQGGAYRNLRAKVRKARERHNWVIEPLGPENMDAAKEVLYRWESKRERTGDGDAALLGLNHFEALGFQGILAKTEEGPQAIAFGAIIAPDVFDFHVEKTLIPSTVNYIKWELYQRLPPQIQWINLEEDLGLPGLKNNKLQAVPAAITPLWKGVPV